MIEVFSKCRLSRIGIFACVLAVVLVMMQACVTAHPPSDVSLSYDKVSGVLTVIVEHDSDDITIHNIRLLMITINEAPPEDIVPFNWDENEEGVVATYNISVSDGDWVYGEAICSINGVAYAELEIGAESDDTSSSTPGFEGIVLFGAVLCIFLVRRLIVSRR